MICQNLRMETSCSSVDHAHKLRDGILVYFDDGRIAFFSASLLCAALPLAIEFRDADLDGDLGQREHRVLCLPLPK